MIITTSQADDVAMRLLLDCMSLTATRAELPESAYAYSLCPEELKRLLDEIGLDATESGKH